MFCLIFLWHVNKYKLNGYKQRDSRDDRLSLWTFSENVEGTCCFSSLRNIILAIKVFIFSQHF